MPSKTLDGTLPQCILRFRPQANALTNCWFHWARASGQQSCSCSWCLNRPLPHRGEFSSCTRSAPTLRRGVRVAGRFREELIKLSAESIDLYESFT